MWGGALATSRLLWRGTLLSTSFWTHLSLEPPFSIPHPQAEWSPGQSTKWPFATKHLEMPEGSCGLSVTPGSHSHTVTHTALRRLRQQAWPNWAQLLSPPAPGVWLLPKQAEGGEAGNGRLTRPGEGSGGRKARALQASLQACWLPLEGAQLRLGSPDHKPPGKRGTERGEESGARVLGLWKKPVLSIFTSIKPHLLCHLPLCPSHRNERPLRAIEEVPRPPNQPCP